MTIPIPLLQSQMAINRKVIDRLHSDLIEEFRARAWYKENSNSERVADCNLHIAKTRKRIARLVQLQKALKAEMGRQHLSVRVKKTIAKYSTRKQK